MKYILILLKTIKNNWLGCLFSFSRFFELTVLFFAISLCAKKIGPTEMADSISVFLYITYASYLGAGGTLVLYKKYLLIHDSAKKRICNSVFRWYLVSAIIGFLFAVIIMKKEYGVITGIIVICNFHRTYLETICRLKKRIISVSVSDILLSTITILGCYLFVNSFRSYLIVFAFGKIFSLAIYVVVLQSFVWERILGLWSRIKLEYQVSILVQGIKLAALTLCASLILNCDKMIVSLYKNDKVNQGIYQLADNIANVTPTLINIFAVFYFPEIIKKLKHGNRAFTKEYYVNVIKLMSIVPVLVLFLYAGTRIVQPVLFVEYKTLSSYVLLLSIGKVFTAFFPLLSYVLISQDKETSLLLYYGITILILLGTFYTLFAMGSPIINLAIGASIALPLALASFCFYILLQSKRLIE